MSKRNKNRRLEQGAATNKTRGEETGSNKRTGLPLNRGVTAVLLGALCTGVALLGSEAGVWRGAGANEILEVSVAPQTTISSRPADVATVATPSNEVAMGPSGADHAQPPKAVAQAKHQGSRSPKDTDPQPSMIYMAEKNSGAKGSTGAMDNLLQAMDTLESER